MAEHDSERAWNEYEWERFLQQQDERTEKYMELLEKFIDDPNRDEIVAREMGWNETPESRIDDWCDEDFGEEEDGPPAIEMASERAEGFEQNALYRASFSLTIWLDRLFDKIPTLQTDPDAVRLATHAALAAAKLAAALSDEDESEIGMTIAYLKRALKAVTTAMEAGADLARDGAITRAQYGTLQKRLFQVRDGIISLMGEFRGEWLRRYGRL
ncbi:MAG TPA: hypothetical protein VGG02_14740 [Chthoniobacterales bacterium]|jgi:hypothetical protein